MRKIIIIISVIFFASSCSTKSSNKPTKFLEQKEFVNILVEIHLSDATAEEKAQGDVKIENLIASKGIAQILKNKNLNRPQFDSIFNFYVRDPKLLNEVYTDVIDELSRKQAELVR
jgi:hypothetical protein